VRILKLQAEFITYTQHAICIILEFHMQSVCKYTAVCWDVTSCSVVETDRHFEGMRCLNVQGRRHVQTARSSYTASHPISQHSSHCVSVIKTSQFMLYWEIIAVSSQIHTKHTNTLCGQNVELYKDPVRTAQ